MFLFCPKCGYIFKGDVDACPVCEYAVHPVPEQYLSQNKNFFKDQATRETFIDVVIRRSEVYEESIAQNKEQILRDKQQKYTEEVAEKVKEYKASIPTAKCPICGSSYLSRISNVGKFVKISAFGILGAGDLGKRSRCETCGHKF